MNVKGGVLESYQTNFLKASSGEDNVYEVGYLLAVEALG